MNFYLIVSVCIFNFLVALFFTKWLSYYYEKIGILDFPTDRSIHKAPISKGGGGGIIFTIVISHFLFWLLDIPLTGWELWAGVILIALTGFMEDRKGLPISIRLAVQVIVSIFIIFQTKGFTQFPFPQPLNFELGWLAFPLNLIWLISVTNFFNFMDGIDGYAGTQAFISSIFLALIGFSGPVFYTGLVIAFACLGFLIWNWHPAKVFMGETGAATLGFLFAALPFFINSIPTDQDVFMVAIFLWFFLADGAFTLLRRAFKGEKVWQAHRSHLYQRLVISGLNHVQVALGVMTSALFLSIFTLFCWKNGFNMWYPLFLGVVLFISYWAFTVFREQKAASVNQ